MKEIKGEPLQAMAFMCNMQSHWIAIRKLGNCWYDLNSLNKFPKKLSDLYLGMYLQQLESEQYTIFVIQGTMPTPSRPEYNQWVSQRNAKYWTPSEIDAATATENGRPAPVGGVDPNEDPELAAAIAASLAESNESNKQQKTESSATASAPQPKEHFHGAGQRLGGPSTVPDTSDVDPGDDEEAQMLAAAIALSYEGVVPEAVPAEDEDDTALQEVPEEPTSTADSVKLRMQMPNGQNVTRRFATSNLVKDVVNFVMKVCHDEGNQVARSKILLSNTYPKQEFHDLAVDLKSVGLTGSAMLHISIS